jgi:hypothetical protein
MKYRFVSLGGGLTRAQNFISLFIKMNIQKMVDICKTYKSQRTPREFLLENLDNIMSYRADSL